MACCDLSGFSAFLFRHNFRELFAYVYVSVCLVCLLSPVLSRSLRLVAAALLYGWPPYPARSSTAPTRSCSRRSVWVPTVAAATATTKTTTAILIQPPLTRHKEQETLCRHPKEGLTPFSMKAAAVALGRRVGRRRSTSHSSTARPAASGSATQSAVMTWMSTLATVRPAPMVTWIA